MENKASSQDRVPRVQQGSTAPPRTSTPSRVTITIAEAALLLGLSESATYEAAARGEIPAIRIGRRVLVKRDQLLVMLGDGPPTAETA